MQLHKRLLFLFLIILFFSANCKAQLLPDEPIRFHKDYSENGLVFGSITFPEAKMKFDGYVLWIKRLEDGKWKSFGKIYLEPQPFKKKHNGEIDQGRTYLFAFEKPPGQYDIPMLRLVAQKVLYDGKDNDLTGFSIPFEVKKGEITYIGNININEYATKGEPIITLEDKFIKDKNSLKYLQKMVNWEAAVKSKLELIVTDGQ